MKKRFEKLRGPLGLFALMLIVTAALSIGRPGDHGYGCRSILSTPSAHAQAGPDHEGILAVLVGMKQDINHMIALVQRHRTGAISVGEETVTLTTAQQDQLIARYATLKTSLAAKYQQLP